MLWETNTKFKATIGTGFKAPSLYYLYDPAYGNENLNPEESFGWDFGIEQYLLHKTYLLVQHFSTTSLAICSVLIT